MADFLEKKMDLNSKYLDVQGSGHVYKKAAPCAMARTFQPDTLRISSARPGHKCKGTVAASMI
jgi:hypothetical protein